MSHLSEVYGPFPKFSHFNDLKKIDELQFKLRGEYNSPEQELYWEVIRPFLQKKAERILSFEKKLTLHLSTERGSGDCRSWTVEVESLDKAIKIARRRPSNRVGDTDDCFLHCSEGSINMQLWCS